MPHARPSGVLSIDYPHPRRYWLDTPRVVHHLSSRTQESKKSFLFDAARIATLYLDSRCEVVGASIVLRLGDVLGLENLRDDFAVNIGETEIAALKPVRQTSVIDAEAMEDRCLQVVNVDGVRRNVVGIVIRLADRQTRFDATTGQPHGEAARMMVPAVLSLI